MAITPSPRRHFTSSVNLRREEENFSYVGNNDILNPDPVMPDAPPGVFLFWA